MADLQKQARNCYDMAYFALPRYVYTDFPKLHAELSKGSVGAAYFYVLTCMVGKTEPDGDVARAFEVFNGTLDETDSYHIIRYPSPPAVPDVTHSPDPGKALQGVILSPYFSAVIFDSAGTNVRYFILGQSPVGATTFRSVSPEFNANLGPGCAPEVEAFVELLRTSRSRAPVAGIGRAPPGSNLQPMSPEAAARRLSARAAGRKKWWQFWK
ncbi:MAG TPA: hypothetical protein VFE47_18595 [Tepidisphaeraceae bacterium]|jgi:hypothetical protein|nr:hypothetical protein [Tepidisphaeraceae bacterium]